MLESQATSKSPSCVRVCVWKVGEKFGRVSVRARDQWNLMGQALRDPATSGPGTLCVGMTSPLKTITVPVTHVSEHLSPLCPVQTQSQPFVARFCREPRTARTNDVSKNSRLEKGIHSTQLRCSRGHSLTSGGGPRDAADNRVRRSIAPHSARTTKARQQNAGPSSVLARRQRDLEI